MLMHQTWVSWVNIIAHNVERARFEPSLHPSCKQKQAMVMIKSMALHPEDALRERASSICWILCMHDGRGKDMRAEGQTESQTDGEVE